MNDIAHPIEFQELPGSPATGPDLFNGNLDLIKGIEVVVSVLVGRSKITVEQLFALKEGASLALDSSVDDPVELHLDGKLIGRGELVAIGDNFGIRITEINTTGR